MFFMSSEVKAAMGKRIRQLMDGPPKTTSETLGEAIGVTPGAITKWRQAGQIGDEHKVALCRYFNVSLDWLLTGRGGGPADREKHSLTLQIDKLQPPEVRRLQAIVNALAIPSSDDGSRENNA